MKPFAQLVAERCEDPHKAAVEAMARLQRWTMISGGKLVSLDEVAWLGAVFALAGQYVVNKTEPEKSAVEKSTEGNVVTVVATDGVRTPDYLSVGG